MRRYKIRRLKSELLSGSCHGDPTLFLVKNMITTLLGTKLGMASSYDSRGRRVGATVLKLSPNQVIQVKSAEGKDGYSAIQLGVGSKKSVKKPQQGHLKKAKSLENTRWLREVRIRKQVTNFKVENTPQPALEGISSGQEIKVGDIFKVGDAINVSATSKGKGFQGGVRRHGFHGGPKTHGQSDRHRAPGSIGAGTTPGRVYKGKKMAGHMGAKRVSYKGLEVLAIDKDNNLLTIKGGVPGPVGGLVVLTNIGHIKGYTPPPEEKPEEESEEPAKETNGEEKISGKNEPGHTSEDEMGDSAKGTLSTDLGQSKSFSKKGEENASS